MRLMHSMRPFVIPILLLLFACGDRRTPSIPDDASPTTSVDARPRAEAAPTPDARSVAPDARSAVQAELTCEDRMRQATTALQSAIAERQSCQWDHECVMLPQQTRCLTQCPTAVAASEVVAARAAVAEVDRTACEGVEEAGCHPLQGSCAESTAYCRDGRCLVRPASEDAPERPATVIPEQNTRARDNDPPPRPPAGDAEERARRLFDAIVQDDADRAADFYMPREAFLELKGIADPGGYWDRLFPRYLRDIHALHEALPDLDRAEFIRFELVRRGGWVGLRDEGNRLPYHVSRHSWIHYRVGDEERRLEVRVLITWGDRWYLSHLCEFHCEERECCRAPE